MRPLLIRAPGGRTCGIDSAVRLLPDPDLAHQAYNLAGRHPEVDAANDIAPLLAGLEGDMQAVDAQQGFGRHHVA